LSKKKNKKESHTKKISKERELLRPSERKAQESVRGSPWTGCGECGIGARDYCDEAGKKTQPGGGIKVSIFEWQPPRSCHLAKINDHQYGFFYWTWHYLIGVLPCTLRHYFRPRVVAPGQL